jgi:hypothetical protein
MSTQRLEKIARMLSDLHIELSLAAGEGIINYRRRSQTAILRLQEHCLAHIRLPDPSPTETNQETTQ